MPLAYFDHAGSRRLGKVVGDRLIDLVVAAPELPPTIRGFLQAGRCATDRFDQIGDQASEHLPLKDVRLLAPIPDPEKFLGIGMNYADHATEAEKQGIATSAYQIWFNKQVSCIVGPFDEVVKPDASEKMDYEAELGVVIGRTCRHVSVKDAHSVIGGYVVVNDVSARDWQMRTPTHTLGKSFDTHGPIGPWLVLAHEVPDPHDLAIRMFVNGELRQSSNTRYLIHNVFEQIAYLSTVMTLKPGDILATGTPAGVGMSMNPPRFLKAGDVMRVEIDGVGHIENHVVSEPIHDSIQK